jgi:hypothetical protein
MLLMPINTRSRTIVPEFRDGGERVADGKKSAASRGGFSIRDLDVVRRCDYFFTSLFGR